MRKILRFTLIATLLCCTFMLLSPEPVKTCIAETDRLSAGSSLVAEDQKAASGDHSWPGLDITWLDFGPEYRIGGWGMGSEPVETGDGTFSLRLHGIKEGDYKAIAFDVEGRVIAASSDYAYIYDFFDGMAMVVRYYPSGGRMPIMKYGWIDQNGNEVIPVGTFEPGWHNNPEGRFSEGLTSFITFNYAEDAAYPFEVLREGFIDKSGKVVIPADKFVSAGRFSEGLAWVRDASTEKYGFIDKEGAYVIEPVYDGASTFREGLAYVEKDGKAGYIDKEGRVVIPFDLLPIDNNYPEPGFYNGLAAARGQSGRLGYIDKSGDFVIEPVYHEANPFTGEATMVTYMPAENWYMTYLIDRSNRRLTPLGGHFYFFAGGSMESGIIRVGDPKTNLLGAMNMNGAQFIPYSMAYISAAVNGYCLVSPQYTEDGGSYVGILKVSEENKMKQENGMIKVSIDGEVLAINDTDPIIKNDRVLAPMRAILEALGASLSWDEASKTATATRGDTVVTVTIGKNIATVNGEPEELDAPAVINNQRTLVPVRFIAESFGFHVEWDNKNRVVIITT